MDPPHYGTTSRTGLLKNSKANKFSSTKAKITFQKTLPCDATVKETYGTDVRCTEDGRDGRIGATRYAGGNGTRKEAEKRNV